VDWLKGPSLADDREGWVSIVYTGDPGPPRLPAAQFCAPAWTVTTGGEETKEEEALPELADDTESKGSSQGPEEETGLEGAFRTLEMPPVQNSPGDGRWPWEREWAPDARTNMETGRMVLSSLPSREYQDDVDERGTCRIYALRRRFYADLIELHVFRNIEKVIPPPGFEVVARVERDVASNWAPVGAGSDGTPRCKEKGRGAAGTCLRGRRAVQGASAAVSRRAGLWLYLLGRRRAAWQPAHSPRGLLPTL
jgi:hypothetical protein